MKRLVSILSILVLVLSCTEREFGDLGRADNQPEDKPIVLDFGVVLPEMQAVTKSFASNAITDLHAYVFDESGYLVEHTPCAVVSESGFGISSIESEKTTFKMTVTQTSSPRYIHFVANCPVEVTSNTAYTEYDLIGAMEVSGTQDAYWQRIEFPKGIMEPRYDTDEDTAHRLTCIPLIRNFAKITLKVSDKISDFTILGYQVIRIPDKGSVAPFNVNNINANGGFAKYASYDSSIPGYVSSIDYNDLVGNQKFVGISPDDATFDYSITDADLTSAESKYVYERNVIKEKYNEPWIIVKGQFGSGAERYFKLILMNEKGEYYNILRNIEYEMTIEKVTQLDGYGTLEEALAGSPNNGNISYLTETKNLLNISDGTRRLFVSEVEKTIVGNEPVYIYYKYMSSGETVNNKDNVISSNSTVAAGDVISSWAWETDNIPANSTNYPGYAKLKIVPIEEVSATQKKQVITISDGNLSREITLWLQSPFDLEVQCTPSEVLRKIGESVEVKLTLDSDLRESMFPLVFTIEAENLSIYPDATKPNNKMPVVSGKNITIVPSKTAATAVFQYEKTITWDEYYNGGTRKTEFSCYFKTNKVESASKIYVYNSYFGRNKYCEFTNYGEAPLTLTIGSSTITSASGLNLDRWTTSREIDIYTAANKYTTSSGTVTMTENDGITSGTVKIENVVMTDVIYFRYSVRSWGSTTYYYASKTVEDLLKGSQSLTFDTTEL